MPQRNLLKKSVTSYSQNLLGRNGHCDLTFDRVVNIIGNELNRKVKHIELNDEEAITSLVSPNVGFSHAYAKAFVELHRAIETEWLKPEFAYSNKKTPTMTFDRFVKIFLKPAIINTK